ncbi:MAG: hypothetical protein KF774_13745 [Planctomyces sp.]|nr:hypothetical protein [Planctomyces sp.]
MKRFALLLVGLTVASSGSGCCCLGGLFGHGYGGQQCGTPYGAPYGAPAPACGSCGYGPSYSPYGAGFGPGASVTPVGTTAVLPYTGPVYAAAINPAPTL